MKRIVIYDDEAHVGERYAERLRRLDLVNRNFHVESMSTKEFIKEIRVCDFRLSRTRRGEDWKDDKLALDEASIFIIDFDLLKTFGSVMTGENVAYLVRCFSRCGLIIGLNQFGQNTFDLTLRGNPRSYCDLNLGSSHLDNIGLWGGSAKAYRPWYWPSLPDYSASFQEKIDDITRHLDDSIAELLGFKNVINVFPRSASEFLGDKPTETTPRKFVVESGNGLRSKDRQNVTDEMIARIAAARLSKWLERLVLPGQDILIDAPHLVYRYPSLLIGDHRNVTTWNKTVQLASDKLNLNHKIIADFRFQKGYWLSRAAWFWKGISECQSIEEVANPWKKKVTDYVFCEDSSKFFRRKYCLEFVSEVDSPYVQRFIRRHKGVRYRPEFRLFALKR